MLPLRPLTVGGLLRRTAQRFPERPALEHGDQSWTYRELDGAVDLCARRLLAAGIGKGDRAGLWCEAEPRAIIALYALVRIGAVCAMINTSLRGKELSELLQATEIGALLIGDGYKDIRYPQVCREIGAGRPGLLTKVGLGTFVDPRIEGGRMNSCAKDELVKLVDFEGEEYLFYPSFKVDAAILRGTIADEDGNISFARESVINEGFAVANAAKNSGGIVIVQVEYLAKRETLPAKEIKIPGALVDYVVQAKDPKSCWQAEGDYWEPSFSGEIRRPLTSIEPLPLDERKVICRRCAMELRAGDLINLGVGMPADIAKVVNEEGLTGKVTMSTESGMVGGVPSALPSFGSAYDPEAIITPNEMFDLIGGGGLDMTCLGIGEVDKDGNNNVSRMGSRLTGPGGFIDISSATPKVIFAGTLVGRARVKVGDGRLEILEEGTIRKFVDHVGQITFSGKYAPDSQEVLYVTERAVFQLIDHKLTLMEIAPGIDLEKDVLGQMGFRPEISPGLKTMDPALFQEHWGRLGETLR